MIRGTLSVSKVVYWIYSFRSSPILRVVRILEVEKTCFGGKRGKVVEEETPVDGDVSRTGLS